MKRPWIDVSPPLRDGMVRWPDDPEVRIGAVDHGGCRVTVLSMSAHTGTHVDAPLHYIPGGAGVDRIPLEAAIGRARVVAVSADSIGEREMLEIGPRPGERVLFKTRPLWQREVCVPEFPMLTPPAARLFVESGARTVGIDYLSIGDESVHRTLLEAGVTIIEGLDLEKVDPGEYDLICLPLKIAGADGAPARAVVRKRMPASEPRL